MHLQFQSTPFIGSKTLDYPLGHYILHEEDGFVLTSYQKPGSGQLISNIVKQEELERAFHFIPGQKFQVLVTGNKLPPKSLIWEVIADPLNYTYILCHHTGAKAFFRFDGHIHFFTHFEGKRKSLLFYFFAGAFQVMTGFYKGLQIRDHYPLNLMNNRGLLFLQDFVAPFRIFIKPDYCMTYEAITDDLTDARVTLSSSAKVRIVGHEVRRIDFTFFVTKEGIGSFTVRERDKIIEMKLKKLERYDPQDRI